MRIALVGAEYEENLAIRYLWAALEKAGHEVCLIVFNGGQDLEPAASELASSGAELAGLSMVFTLRAAEFALLASRARELGFSGHMVAGGHFATFHAQELLRDVPALDSVGLGEGEKLLVDLASRLDRLNEVPGLVWRRPDGLLIANSAPVKPADLDTLSPPVHRHPFDTFLGIPVANILGSRGCTHSCAFCSISAWHRHCGGERLRLRSPEAVADEMAALYREGVRIFNFHDDNFILPDPCAARERVEILRDAMCRRGLEGIAFAIKARPDEVDRELFLRLREMGLFRVFLGVEAGTAESLHRLGRGQSLDQNERALEVAAELGLHICFNLLLLNPDSTLEDFRANVAFLRSQAHFPLNYCRTEVYAGTPLEARLRRAGRLQGDYWGWNYTIADPRAEQVFQLMYAALSRRNWAMDCLQHLGMQVDYEYHILSRFFGDDPVLHSRVRDFVTRLNRDTCSLLEAAADAAETPFASLDEEEQVVRELRSRMEHADLQLREEGLALVRAIRQRAETICCQIRGVSRNQWVSRSPFRSPFLRRATRAGLAATLALAALPGEAAPTPPDPLPSGGHSSHSDQQRGRKLIYGNPTPKEARRIHRLVQEHLQERILEIARSGDSDEYNLTLWLRPDGKVVRYRLLSRGILLNRRTLNPLEREKVRHLLSLLFRASGEKAEKWANRLGMYGTELIPLIEKRLEQEEHSEASALLDRLCWAKEQAGFMSELDQAVAGMSFGRLGGYRLYREPQEAGRPRSDLVPTVVYEVCASPPKMDILQEMDLLQKAPGEKPAPPRKLDGETVPNKAQPEQKSLEEVVRWEVLSFAGLDLEHEQVARVELELDAGGGVLQVRVLDENGKPWKDAQVEMQLREILGRSFPPTGKSGLWVSKVISVSVRPTMICEVVASPPPPRPRKKL